MYAKLILKSFSKAWIKVMKMMKILKMMIILKMIKILNILKMMKINTNELIIMDELKV